MKWNFSFRAKQVAHTTCFVLLGVILVGSSCPAQNVVVEKFSFGAVERIQSKILGEERTLNIFLPIGYSKDSSFTYPVLYLLDGSDHEDFLHVAGIVQFHTEVTGLLPPMIVVGIANVDRKRDFTFPTTVDQDKKDYPTTGGSAKFIQFIEEELQPFVTSHYLTNNRRMIIGQSLGGLLATEILLKKPQLFTDYLIVSPSLWWNNGSLLAEAEVLLKSATEKPEKIIIAVGGREEDVMVKDAQQLSQLLESKSSGSQFVHFMPMPAEDHLTILHNCVYDALLRFWEVKH